MASAKECSCANHLTLQQIMRLVQVVSETTEIPAIFINPKIYKREIGARIRYANGTLEQYIRKISKTGGKGTLMLNVALIPVLEPDSLHCCKTHKTKTDTIDDMFCITQDDEVALKLAYYVGDMGDWGEDDPRYNNSVQ